MLIPALATGPPTRVSGKLGPFRAAGTPRFSTFLNILRSIRSGQGLPAQRAADPSCPRSGRFWLLELNETTLGLHRCRLIMAAVVGSWLIVDVRPELAQSDASPLPSFDFRQAGSAQSRNPSDINPGTLQPLALRLLAGDRPAAIPYEFHAFRSSGLWVRARARWRRFATAGLGALHGQGLEPAAIVRGHSRSASRTGKQGPTSRAA